MSGPGTPPETGTDTSTDDRYNANVTFAPQVDQPTDVTAPDVLGTDQPPDVAPQAPPAAVSATLGAPPVTAAPNSVLTTALNNAMELEGQHEQVNRSDIQEYLKDGGVNMDPAKAAWCAALVNSSIAQAGGKGTGSQVATSFLNYGQPATTPQYGDVLVQARGHAAGQTGGHVGFATGQTRDGPTGPEIEMFSGNKGDKAVRSWEPAGSVQIRRMPGQAAAQAAASAPAAPATPQFGDPGYNLEPIAPEFKGADIPFSQQLQALSNLDTPVTPIDQDQQTPLENFETFQIGMPPKGAIPSQMFDNPVTFTRSPNNTPIPKELNYSKQQSFPMFESNYDINNPPPAYETPVNDIPFEQRTHMQKLDSAVRAVNQLARGTLNQGTGFVYGLGQAAGAVVALPSRLAGFEGGEADRMFNYFTGLRAAAERGNADITGLSGQGAAPQTGLEKLMLNTGESIIPAGKYTVPLTAGLVGLREAISPAEAAPRKKAGSVADSFAGMLSSGNIDVRNPTQPINVIYVPDEVAKDGSVIVAPSSSLYGKVNLPPDKALEQYNRVGAFYGHFQSQQDAENFVNAINDRVTISTNTVAGPTKVTTGELALMGTLGAASIGAAFAPQVFSMFSKSTPRLGRPVDAAAPGTEAFTTRGDAFRTYVDDVNGGIMRVAGQVVQDQGKLDNLRNLFTLQTRGAASNIADSAVRNGISVGPNFTFQVKVPLGDLQAKATPEMEQYLNLMDTFDDLQKLQKVGTAAAVRTAALPGPPVVRGLTEADVLSQVGALEATNPELRQVGAAYRDNLRQLRAFESRGEWAMTTPKEAKRLNSENPNEVPFLGVDRVWEDPNYVRQSPFVALGENMRTRMRTRMENEAKGAYIDAMREAEPSSFVRVTQQQLNDNPHWGPNTVTVYRRGKPEKYTTDPHIADVLKMDPYYFQNGALDLMYKTKRIVEATTTGMFAPWFAETSFLRNHQIIAPTAATIPGVKQPYPLQSAYQSVAAIPQQLGPQLAGFGSKTVNGPAAQAIYNTLDRASGGWLNQTLGPQFLQSLSKRLQTIHDTSLYARLEAAGSHRGSILEHQIRDPNAMHWRRLTQTNNALLNSAINTTQGLTRTFLEGWKHTLGAVHNAPSYAFARRNADRFTIPELAGMTRQVTGDPMSGGQFTNKGRVIRFQDEGFGGMLKTRGVQALGGVAEAGRIAVPWFNPSLQGMKRIGQAYMENPKKFVANMWLYTQLPAATAYAWNRAIGNDPQGVSYSDYHMNGRSQYNTMMNYYLGVPGRPASEGIQIPRFHELAPMARWMEIAMDHAFRSSKYSASEDFMNVATNGVKVIFEPSTPPLINLGFAGAGMVGPQGAFSGDAYKRTSQPFDQNSGLPANIELYMRAVAPGLADIFGSGLSAAIQADEGKSRVGAFLSEAGKRVVSKAPITRAITNIQPPATGNTRYTEDLFAKQKAISDLDRFYKDWGLTGGNLNIGAKTARSVEGGKIATDALGQPLPRGAPGMGQPEPTNPLYKMFAQEMHDTFKKDDPKNGGIGFQSMWKRYTDATKAIKTVQSVSAGNFVTWQRYLDSVPETKAFLQDAGVDYRNPLAVKSFYESYRQAAAKELLFTIKRVENEFSQRLGRPIKFEDLQPYGQGLPPEDPSNMFDLGFQETAPAP